jgi:hypothetical protein
MQLPVHLSSQVKATQDPPTPANLPSSQFHQCDNTGMDVVEDNSMDRNMARELGSMDNNKDNMAVVSVLDRKKPAAHLLVYADMHMDTAQSSGLNT